MTALLTINNAHKLSTPRLEMPPRLLLGAGPSNADPRVISAMSRPQVGHLDTYFLKLMGEIQELLRYTFQTDNKLTIPVSGTGSAAMEATLANTVEPNDVVLVAVKGYFGKRLVDMAGRYGADVRQINKPWGEAFSLAELRSALETHRPAILAIVHAETSTGVRQPLEGIGDLCREFDCLLLVDTVTSLGCVPLLLDEWKVDLAYSCSQKGLSCPPGASPLTLSDRALEKVHSRKTKVANWYLDLSLVSKYWGKERTYHHTAPINMNYALYEALCLVAEEGLEARWERHQKTAELLWNGLADLGLSCYVAPELRLPSLTTVGLPDGVDEAKIRRQLLDDHNIEISGGLGDLAGKVWRIGLMGQNSRPENVERLLTTLKKLL
ncbi:pyridoxal-phosphate-dependent aminotransferase family protein [Roseofilum casamattae]|uniref:Alanine--glyoxylate aminotransferase family protein n=1 Tax=Roseofilum casamattae BLCC-M143 TaxID=3022442 RepID=A0ABT7C2B3_9CYAN|nr:alanine--glyoxylate aminotransferase family protein [Roseofilum casamattae]MDJ1185593.1 alanine--glyoxylate aminotransferase family protein [Roseofilum casamattae BLCC-M143]